MTVTEAPEESKLIQVQIVVGRFILLDLTAFATVAVEEEDEPEPVLPFGFVVAERNEPQSDPVFRDLEP